MTEGKDGLHALVVHGMDARHVAGARGHHVDVAGYVLGQRSIGRADQVETLCRVQIAAEVGGRSGRGRMDEKLTQWAEPDQQSIRSPDGAGRLIRVLQSIVATAGIDSVLMQGDLVSAYGQRS